MIAPQRNTEMEEWVDKGYSVLVYGGERPLGAWHAQAIADWELVWLAKRANAVWFPQIPMADIVDMFSVVIQQGESSS